MASRFVSPHMKVMKLSQYRCSLSLCCVAFVSLAVSVTLAITFALTLTTVQACRSQQPPVDDCPDGSATAGVIPVPLAFVLFALSCMVCMALLLRRREFGTFKDIPFDREPHLRCGLTATGAAVADGFAEYLRDYRHGNSVDRRLQECYARAVDTERGPMQLTLVKQPGVVALREAARLVVGARRLMIDWWPIEPETFSCEDLVDVFTEVKQVQLRVRGGGMPLALGSLSEMRHLRALHIALVGNGEVRQDLLDGLAELKRLTHLTLLVYDADTHAPALSFGAVAHALRKVRVLTLSAQLFETDELAGALADMSALHTLRLVGGEVRLSQLAPLCTRLRTLAVLRASNGLLAEFTDSDDVDALVSQTLTPLACVEKVQLQGVRLQEALDGLRKQRAGIADLRSEYVSQFDFDGLFFGNADVDVGDGVLGGLAGVHARCGSGQEVGRALTYVAGIGDEANAKLTRKGTKFAGLRPRKVSERRRRVSSRRNNE